jgi:hypothetical protein
MLFHEPSLDWIPSGTPSGVHNWRQQEVGREFGGIGYIGYEGPAVG